MYTQPLRIKREKKGQMPQDVYIFQYTLHSIYTNSKQSVHPVTVVFKLLFHKLHRALAWFPLYKLCITLSQIHKYFMPARKQLLGYKQLLTAQKNEEGIPEKKADLPSFQSLRFVTAISKKAFRTVFAKSFPQGSNLMKEHYIKIFQRLLPTVLRFKSHSLEHLILQELAPPHFPPAQSPANPSQPSIN